MINICHRRRVAVFYTLGLRNCSRSLLHKILLRVVHTLQSVYEVDKNVSLWIFNQLKNIIKYDWSKAVVVMRIIEKYSHLHSFQFSYAALHGSKKYHMPSDINFKNIKGSKLCKTHCITDQYFIKTQRSNL